MITYKLIYSNGAPDNNEDEICLFTVKPDWPMRYAVRIAIANFLTHDFNAVIIVGSPDIIILYAHLIEEPADFLLTSSGCHTEHRAERCQLVIVFIG